MGARKYNGQNSLFQLPPLFEMAGKQNSNPALGIG
jgi:hypothetical protein